MGMITRRDFVGAAGAAWLAGPAGAQTDELLLRAIPSSGERIPAVGLGTAVVFNRDDEPTRAKASAVLRALVDHGGKLVDTASAYGDAEIVVGDAVAKAGLRDKLFIATKVVEPDLAEFERSLQRLKTPKVDLLQLHNVNERKRSLAALREWKAQGRCRYVGITSTFHGDFPVLEAMLEREKPDFVQVDYSLDQRLAEQRILPLAAQVKVAVLTALPFGRNRLFRAVRGRALPEWAGGFAQSWAQFFLKYLLADPRVTAVIPGTSDPAHLIDNLGAMHGRLPDAQERARMVAFVEAL